MSLTLKTVAATAKPKGKVARQRLYFTADRRRVVQRGHPEAAFLLAAQGQLIPDKDLPLVDQFESDQKPAPKAEGKSISEPINVVEPEPIANRETRVPKMLRKRGRPRKEIDAKEE